MRTSAFIYFARSSQDTPKSSKASNCSNSSPLATSWDCILKADAFKNC